jgi:hypothetical protein
MIKSLVAAAASRSVSAGYAFAQNSNRRSRRYGPGDPRPDPGNNDPASTGSHQSQMQHRRTGAGNELGPQHTTCDTNLPRRPRPKFPAAQASTARRLRPSSPAAESRRCSARAAERRQPVITLVATIRVGTPGTSPKGRCPLIPPP